MNYEDVNVNAMKALGYRIARRFEHCRVHHGFDAYRPNKVRSLQIENSIHQRKGHNLE